MRSPNKFIVTPYNNKRYDNTLKIGDIDIIISTSEENHKASNRFAIVKEIPIGYNGDIKQGDILVVHHNLFKFYNDVQFKRRSSGAFFKDNLFFVGMEQFYLYGQMSNWKCHDRYCFVKPIKSNNKNCYYEPLTGEMKYVNSYLIDNEIKIGDIVYFTPDSEYEFQIEGEKLYRIYDHQICGKRENN